MNANLLKLVLCLLALYFMILMFLLFKYLCPKKTVNGKLKRQFSTAALTPSLICSKLIWAFVGVIMAVYALSLILPMFWLFYTSLKDDWAYGLSSFALPEWGKLHWDNYRMALMHFEVTNAKGYTYGLPTMFFNSIYHAFFGAFVGVFWITLVAYVLARIKFFGNKFIYNLGIVIMLISLVGNTASQMMLYIKWGIYDKLYITSLLPPATAFSGTYFLILYGAFKAIPHTYTEAAELDGANAYTVMFRIIIPMVIPTCATLFLLSFISCWNTYESFLVWYPSSPNMAYGLYRFQSGIGATAGATGIEETDVFAGYVIVMIPSMILYLSSQKLIRSKFTIGGLKG